MASSPTESDASAAAVNGDTPASSAPPTPAPSSSANTTPAESVDLEVPSQTRETVPQDAHKLAGVKRKLKPEVLDKFGRVFFRGKWKAECQWCHSKLGGETKDVTSHLHAHLATCAARQTTRALSFGPIILSVYQLCCET